MWCVLVVQRIEWVRDKLGFGFPVDACFDVPWFCLLPTSLRIGCPRWTAVTSFLCDFSLRLQCRELSGEKQIFDKASHKMAERSKIQFLCFVFFSLFFSFSYCIQGFEICFYSGKLSRAFCDSVWNLIKLRPRGFFSSWYALFSDSVLLGLKIPVLCLLSLIQ